MVTDKIKNTCKFGHTFYKSSECPNCPVCGKLKEPASVFLMLLSNPARNALLHHGIDTIQKLSFYTEKDILKIHGIGKASLPALRKSLGEKGLTFKQEKEITKKTKKTKEIDNFTIKYHANGKTIWSKGQIIDGKPEGYWEWFRLDGTIKRSGYFSYGEPVGKWITYDNKGNVYKVTNK